VGAVCAHTVGDTLAAAENLQVVPYSDDNFANRNVRVWHGATENGPWTMDESQTLASYV
jgi:hypothetical protein